MYKGPQPQSPKELVDQHEFLEKDFICIWDNIVPPELCDWIVDWSKTLTTINERNDRHRQDNQGILHIYHPHEANLLMRYVNTCATVYTDKYPYLKNFPLHNGSVLVQRTKPKQGYHYFHAEDGGYAIRNIELAWMVYLNDVSDGGETEFLYQQLKVKPKKGRVVIWPGSFTHQHRGNPPMSEKYIATGWYVNSLFFERGMFDPNQPLDISPTPR
jgi:hypothetical protein